MEIARNIAEIKESLPDGVKLVAVTKTKTVEVIMEAYQAGHKIFGENKVQELVQKQQQLPDDIEWHFIGHLQSNKVKSIIQIVSLVHGVDSFKILKAINREAEKYDLKIRCLMQFHIAREATKFGLTLNEARDILESKEYSQMANISIAGVMGMATFTINDEWIINEFRMLKSIFDILKLDYFSGNPDFTQISMGMSDDYLLAVKEGSTLVRIGSKIFGSR
jgi:PLP dependent protein